MNFLHSLKNRWKLQSVGQVVIVLLVFSCTGFSIFFLKKPLLELIDTDEEYGTLFSVLYYILILPVYNLILLVYGFVFGQFKFFWSFEKKMWHRMTGQKESIENE